MAELLQEVLADRLVLKYRLPYTPKLSSVERFAQGWTVVAEDVPFIFFDDGAIVELK